MRDDDVLACLDLDPSYQTDVVWQLIRQERGDVLDFQIRPVALPRTRAVEGFPLEPPLEARVAAADCALLVERDETPLGYLLAALTPRSATLDLIVVGARWRRTGIGGRLLREARWWAGRAGRRWMDATVEARNFPAVAFLRQHGFRVVGVRDTSGREDEVMLFLTGPVTG
ncbi:MAG: GNAT family N-acetyltransferase [Dehalococcoidia bacterium]|nr:GNAT family N-acetyltransferase [Dehalococcoidia bacterium]